MSSRLRRGLGALLVLLVLALLLGSLAGRPVMVGVVDSGSMSPTLGTGDGFVSVPREVGGELGPGAIVVFRAESLHGGGLVTHRIVGETAEGYVTKGDANAFTDQATDEPPVPDSRVVAVVPQVAGQPLVIPGLGVVVDAVAGLLEGVLGTLAGLPIVPGRLGPRSVALVVFLGSVAWYVAAGRLAGDRQSARTTERETGLDPRLLVGVAVLAIVLAATASMVGPGGGGTVSVVSAEFDAPGARVIPAGETETTTRPIGNGGFVPVLVIHETADEAVSVDPAAVTVPARATANVTVTVTAPPETGYYTHHVQRHRYLALLPTDWLHALYRVHPWLPVLAVDLVVAVPMGVLGLALAGRTRLRDRARRAGPGPLRRLVGILY